MEADLLIGTREKTKREKAKGGDPGQRPAAATFFIAALVHFGLLVGGYAHREASIAETVIAVVLLTGLALTWMRPASTRGIGMAAQGFALFGTLVGIFTIAIGVGPRSAPDIIYHVGIVIVLVCGLLVAARARLAA